MSLFVLGISHLTAPVAIRERLAFTRDELPGALRDLKRLSGVTECVILSTCNRTELYLEGNLNTAEDIIGWMCRRHQLPLHEYRSYLYQKVDLACVEHLMAVTASMDSMVLGEPQITGQVKQAWAAAREQNCLDTQLDRLFQHAFSAVKRVRSETDIGRNPVSLPFAALKLARQIFGELETLHITLVGAGKMVTDCARHFHAAGLDQMTIINRRVQRAQDLAARFGGRALDLTQIETVLPTSDIIVSSTASDTAVLHADAFGRALKARRRRPMFVLDLAVPRDVEPEVGKLADVYLYTVDDLQEIVAGGRDQRGQAMARATEIVRAEAHEFQRWLNLASADRTLKTIRDQAQAEQARLLKAAEQELAAGKAAPEVLKRLAHRLSNTLLHTPSVRLREAAENADEKLLAAADYFFLDNIDQIDNER